VDFVDAINGGAAADIHFLQYGWDRHDLTVKDGVLHVGTHTTSWKQDPTTTLYLQPWNTQRTATSLVIDFANIDAKYDHSMKLIIRPVDAYPGTQDKLWQAIKLRQGASHYELDLPEGWVMVRIEMTFDNASPGFDITRFTYETSYQAVSSQSEVSVNEVAVSEIHSIEDSSDADVTATATANSDVSPDSGVADEKPIDSDSALETDVQPAGVISTEDPDTALDLQGIEYSTSVDGDIQTEGGAGVLKLMGSGLVLDLANVEEKLSSIEVFDITGAGNNTLKLSLGDVLELGAEDLFIADGHRQLMVKGDAGDKVELSDLLPDGEDLGNWVQESGTTTVDGVEYNVFYHAGLNAELLVQQGVETTLNNH
jgi:hypothetical protein